MNGLLKHLRTAGGRPVSDTPVGLSVDREESSNGDVPWRVSV